MLFLVVISTWQAQMTSQITMSATWDLMHGVRLVTTNSPIRPHTPTILCSEDWLILNFCLGVLRWALRILMKVLIPLFGGDAQKQNSTTKHQSTLLHILLLSPLTWVVQDLNLFWWDWNFYHYNHSIQNQKDIIRRISFIMSKRKSLDYRNGNKRTPRKDVSEYHQKQEKEGIT